MVTCLWYYFLICGFGCYAVKPLRMYVICLFAMGPFFALENLSDVTKASNLNDKMKVVFEEARREEKGIIRVLQNLCFSMNISLSENRRLVAELELVVERGEAAKSLQQIRNIVASQTAIYGEPDKVLAHAFVGLSLKSGYIGYVKEEE
ncbi:hypothetical protein Tco_1167912 [Tanacetum coccineum]